MRSGVEFGKASMIWGLDGSVTGTKTGGGSLNNGVTLSQLDESLMNVN